MDRFINVIEPEVSDKPTVKGWRLIAGYNGFFVMLLGFVLLVPLLCLFAYPEEVKYLPCFLVPGLICIGVGALFFFLFIYKRKHGQLQVHQDAFIVMSCWVIASLVCAIPFVASGIMNFHQAFFEATSGMTTTGLTVLSTEADYANFPHIFFLLRSMTHLIGGIGVVLIMISILSDRYGMKLYSSEGHYDRVLPNLIKSSRTLILIYLGFILAGIIGYLICGMSLFDAINHSIAAFATGGFSTHADSIGFFNSGAVEAVTIVLMLCGSLNFLGYIFILKGKLKNFFKYCENKCMFFALAIIIPLAAMALFFAGSYGMGEAWRKGAFQIVSSMTSCGFQTMPLIADGVQKTSSAFLLIVIAAMLIGGQTNSTSGGFKIYRLNLLVKSFYIKVRDSFRKNKVVHYYRTSMLDEDTYLTKEMVHQSNFYIISFFIVYIVSTLIMCFMGYSLTESLFTMASSLGTVGLSVGSISMTCPTSLYYLSLIVMYLGRLEIFVIVYGLIYAVRTPYNTVLGALKSRKEKR